MVFPISFTAILAYGIFSVSAAPVADVTAAAVAPLVAQASIYMCDNIRWNGSCRNILVNLDSCTNVPSDWNDRISSIRNDSRSQYKCTWFENGNCGGKTYDNQDDANLADGNGFFNDRISSISCKNK